MGFSLGLPLSLFCAGLILLYFILKWKVVTNNQDEIIQMIGKADDLSNGFTMKDIMKNDGKSSRKSSINS